MGGPDPPKPTANKRGRQSAGQTSTLNGDAAKKQRKSGDRNEADASAKHKNLVDSNNDDDLNLPGPNEYPGILGPNEWTPPEGFQRVLGSVCADIGDCRS